MKIKTSIIGMFLMLIILFAPSSVFAAHDTWNDVVNDMEEILNQALVMYKEGNPDQAKEEVDVAYFGHYEKLGFEKTVMSYISGKRSSVVEYQFSEVKKLIGSDAPAGQVTKEVATLVNYLREDANVLDGKKESKSSVFFSSLVIILREGVEAILIVGVILAYLRKTNNAEKSIIVYYGIGSALVLSVAMAYIVNTLNVLTGANQEIVEGVTMLVAVVVMFYVSNWMIGKADAEIWTGYIEGKVDSSLKRSSVFSLAFTAFLAVFREGAETILFYQALSSGTLDHKELIWVGFVVGCFLLAIVYLIIHFFSIRIPMKAFFVSTSLILFIMTITFLGKGIKELQEGNLISVTLMNGVNALPLLGVYPTVETLVPQIILVLITIGTIFYQIKKWKKIRR